MKRVFTDPKAQYKIAVTAKLSCLRGNAKPYFSLTASGKDRGSEFGGCCHEEILKHWPDLRPLADLHLSDIDGIPMHAEANGWYSLVAALGGRGEAYHAGNSKRHFPCEAPADKPWQTTEYRMPTQAECVQIFADHCRLPLVDAQAFIATLHIPPMPIGNAAKPIIKKDNAAIRAQWAAFCNAQKPRWFAEANAAIEKFALERPKVAA